MIHSRHAYRPDIDGLRAIAIVAVVGFHAHFPGFSGGFLGVDVFFVISGFLITQILSREESNAPNLLAFYERRIRRIVPALAFVLAAAVGAALLLLLPFELKHFAMTLVAATTFVSNFYFVFGAGYFQPRATNEALLHLWSLGVEEQFYIFFPLFIWGLRRKAKVALLNAIFVVFVASLLLSIWGAARHPTGAFYFTPGRAWELFLGALTALAPLRRFGFGRLDEMLGLVALLAIIAPVAIFTRQTTWPGLNALIPCAGTALLLYPGMPLTVVSRILGARLPVAIGLISYSLYLWHWPVFVFFERAVLRPVLPFEYAALIALSFVVAWFSWWFIERPFRRRDGGIGRKTVFRDAALAGGGLLAVSVGCYVLDGLPARFSPAVLRVNSILDYRSNPDFQRKIHSGTCFPWHPGDRYDFKRCFVIAPDRRNVLLWGDSYAMHYFVGLEREAQAAGVHVIQATYASCRPVLANPNAREACAAFNREVFARLDHRITAVILSARLFEQASILPSLADTARQISSRGIRAIVLGPSLEYQKPVPLYVARFVQTGDETFLESAPRLRPDLKSLEGAMQPLFARSAGVSYISVYDAVCHTSQCPMMTQGVPMEFDEGHLTMEGSRLLGRKLWPQIALALSEPVNKH